MTLTFNEVRESMQANRTAVYSGRFCLTLNGITTPIHGITLMGNGVGFWVKPVAEGAPHVQVKDGDTIIIMPVI